MLANPATPVVVTPVRRAKGWPIIASVLCLGLLLFLIAATIVLALIPLYINKRTTELNGVTRQSAPVTLVTEADVDADNVSSLTGGQFGDQGNQAVRTSLLNTLRSPAVKDVQVVSTTISSISKKKKRFSLSKRERARVRITIVFIIIFSDLCQPECQRKVANTLAAALTRGAATFSFTNIEIFRDGRSIGTLRSIVILLVVSLTNIGPAGDITTTIAPVTSSTESTSTLTSTSTSTSTTSVISTSTSTIAMTPAVG